MFAAASFNRARDASSRSLGKPVSSFPSSIATDAKLAIAVDRLQTTLGATLDAVSLTMTVTDASKIVPWVLLSIDNEIVQVTGAPSGAQVPISRAFDGTAGAIHLSGAAVNGYVDAWHHNTLASEIEAIETALGTNLSAIPTSPLVVSNAFKFVPQTPGGSLVVGANSVTLTPVPPGVNGGDANHYLYISGGTGTAEAALIIGGSAVAGSSSGTLIIQCANTHSGPWTIRSASDGIQEAIISVGPVTSNYLGGGTGGGIVFIPVGMHDVYAPITLTSNVWLLGGNSHSATVRSNGTTIIRTLGSAMTGCVGCGIQNLHLDLNLQPNIIGLDLYGCMAGTFRDLFIDRGNSQTGKAIYMHGSPNVGGTWGPDYCADCLFDHIHIEEGPSTCLALHRTTLCTFRLCRFSCDTGPIIDLIAATDTNYFYDIDLNSGTASQGIYCNSSNTPPDANFGVGAFHFYNVCTEGTNSGVGIVLGNVQDIHVTNFAGTWNTPFIFTSTTQGCRISNIFGFGMTERISEWHSDGLIVGTTTSPSFVAFNHFAPGLANGPNNNINIANAGFLLISAPSAAFSISGFTGGIDGRVLYVLNNVPFQMTIQNQNAASAAANQIYTLTGADVVLRAGRSCAQFIYVGGLNAWVLMSTN